MSRGTQHASRASSGGLQSTVSRSGIARLWARGLTAASGLSLSITLICVTQSKKPIGVKVNFDAPLDLPPSPKPASTLTPFTGIVARPVRWLMQDYIALGKITALAGRPKIGKGLWYSRLIADVTRGRVPGDLTRPARAIIVTTEDDPGDTLKPRLMAAGADLDLVSIFRMGSKDEPVPFRVPHDSEELGRQVEDTGALLVVIDPLMEFIDGKTDTYKSQKTRHALSSVNEIARRTGCAVLPIFHLNKGISTDPLLRHEGAAAFTQVVRGSLMLGFDPEDPDGEEGDQRVLAVSSSNLAKKAPSLLYRIDGVTVTGDTNEPISTAAMQHIGESSAASHDLLGGREDDEARADRDEATEFLLAELEEGPRPAGEIKAAAIPAGIGPGALKRAKRQLKVETSREGFGGKGGWIWALPKGDDAKGTQHVHEKPSPLSPLASRAKSEGLKGDKGDKGDGSHERDPFEQNGHDLDLVTEAELQRLAEKFPDEVAL